MQDKLFDKDQHIYLSFQGLAFKINEYVEKWHLLKNKNQKTYKDIQDGILDIVSAFIKIDTAFKESIND